MTTTTGALARDLLKRRKIVNTRRLVSILIVLVAVAAILGLGGWGFSRSGWGMMGGGYGMMGDHDEFYESDESGEPISNEEATAVAQNVIASYRNPDLEVAEIMAFSNHFYVQAREKSTGATRLSSSSIGETAGLMPNLART